MNVVGVVKEVPQGVNLVVGLMCVADGGSGSNLGNAFCCLSLHSAASIQFKLSYDHLYPLKPLSLSSQFSFFLL